MEVLQVVVGFPGCCLPRSVTRCEAKRAAIWIRLDKQTFHSVILLLRLFWQQFQWQNRAERHKSSYSLITEHLCFSSIGEYHLINCSNLCLHHIWGVYAICMAAFTELLMWISLFIRVGQHASGTKHALLNYHFNINFIFSFKPSVLS